METIPTVNPPIKNVARAVVKQMNGSLKASVSVEFYAKEGLSTRRMHEMTSMLSSWVGGWKIIQWEVLDDIEIKA